MVSKLGYKRHMVSSLAFWIAPSEGSQLPLCEGAQAAPWEGSCEELTPLTNSQHQLINYVSEPLRKHILQVTAALINFLPASS